MTIRPQRHRGQQQRASEGQPRQQRVLEPGVDALACAYHQQQQEERLRQDMAQLPWPQVQILAPASGRIQPPSPSQAGQGTQDMAPEEQHPHWDSTPLGSGDRHRVVVDLVVHHRVPVIECAQSCAQRQEEPLALQTAAG